MMIERYQHTAGPVFVTGPGPCTVRSMALGAQQLIKCMGHGWKTRGLGRVYSSCTHVIGTSLSHKTAAPPPNCYAAFITSVLLLHGPSYTEFFFLKIKSYSEDSLPLLSV
ncbi:hypothetical protein PVAP13_6KG281312 [Panicum virgatum]|uniref:Uncharacterized protein n=1 Tax=Panicum virgatum TaxID=38727 RepID=A0A8T0RGE1_PANVG|nr:hypothetical protein PVAP13_6KG281312 [Panicum virgatum]